MLHCNDGLHATENPEPQKLFKRCYLASLDHFLKKSFPLLSTTSTKIITRLQGILKTS
jgi:hypothetical protein